MRYIGNKTRLIPFLLQTLEKLGVAPGVAADPFAGTASVGSALKRGGWKVHAGDLMAASYALQVARIALDTAPHFPPMLLQAGPLGKGARPIPYGEVVSRLDAIPPSHGFVTEHYTPAGAEGAKHGRMYFSERNAGRIDAIRARIAEWSEGARIDHARHQLLVATLIEAADRVANTTGVYASFVKTWQPNALRPLELRPLPITRALNRASGSTAFHGHALDLLGRLSPLDLVYLDPPYNSRQYPGYYHIPELLATGWDPPPPLRGKTGLIPDSGRRSDWCRKGKAESALRRLLEGADARHILLSYNDEGLLPRPVIEAALRERGQPDTYRCFEHRYRRYRSDSDGPSRAYSRDRVSEQLHYVRAR
ncbi:MAG: DNA adenine methylase [Gemmatimonadota bacterium]